MLFKFIPDKLSVMVDLDCQLDITQGHLGRGTSTELPWSNWLMNLSVELSHKCKLMLEGPTTVGGVFPGQLGLSCVGKEAHCESESRSVSCRAPPWPLHQVLPLRPCLQLWHPLIIYGNE